MSAVRSADCVEMDPCNLRETNIRHPETVGILTNHPFSCGAIRAWQAGGVRMAVAAFDEAEIIQSVLSNLPGGETLKVQSLAGGNWQNRLRQWLESTRPWCVWVIGFPRRIPPDCLSLIPGGWWNFHPGKLPQYRGPDPVFWQIRNGEATAALTIHRMTAEFDDGGIVAEYSLPIRAKTHYGDLLDQMGGQIAAAGSALLEQLCTADGPELHPQDGRNAGYQRRPELRELCIDWERQTAQQIDALVRACNPYRTGAIAAIGDHSLYVCSTSVVDAPCTDSACQPGTVQELRADGFDVGCANGTRLRIHVLRDATAIYFAPDWAQLHKLIIGTVFCTPRG